MTVYQVVDMFGKIHGEYFSKSTAEDKASMLNMSEDRNSFYVKSVAAR